METNKRVATLVCRLRARFNFINMITVDFYCNLTCSLEVVNSWCVIILKYTQFTAYWNSKYDFKQDWLFVQYNTEQGHNRSRTYFR